MRFPFRLLLMIAALLAFALAARAEDITYRPPTSTGAELNDDERSILVAINRDRAKHRLDALEPGRALCRLARRHSRDMKENDFFGYDSPTHGPLRYQLHREGISAAITRFQIYRLPGLDDLVLRMYKNDRPVHLESGEHVGIGVQKAFFPRSYHVTLIFAEARATHAAFPAQVKPGATHMLKGSVDEGLTNPIVSIRPPKGDVYTLPVRTSANGGFAAQVSFDSGKGEYIVEVMATGELGPMVCNLMKVYAGVPYPPPEDDGEVERISDVRAAEKEMFRLLNRDRREHGREPLEYDKRLAAVARSHSREMIEARFFAHISPNRGSLADRMERAGISMQQFAENIATDVSVARAQKSLMESPEHRRNILSRELERVGIGIAVDRQGQLYATQNFATPHEDVDPREASKALFKALNAVRAKNGQPALARDPMLDKVARANSRAMAEAGKLGMDRASELLERRLRGGRTYTLAAASGDRPRLEYFRMPPADKLAGFRRVGIGIAGKKEATSGEPRWWATVILLEKR